MLNSEQPLMKVAFLRKLMDFNAIDGQPVSVLFLLVCSTIRIHLHLLARLGNALNNNEFLQLIRAQSTKEQLLQRLHALEYASQKYLVSILTGKAVHSEWYACMGKVRVGAIIACW